LKPSASIRRFVSAGFVSDGFVSATLDESTLDESTLDEIYALGESHAEPLVVLLERRVRSAKSAPKHYRDRGSRLNSAG
jgi:hypothetical protein